MRSSAKRTKRLVQLLAGQAAVAIENARLVIESAIRWSTQLESLNEVASALVSEFELGRLLQLVADRLRELIQASLVTIGLPHGDGARIEAAAGEDAQSHLGMLIPARSKTMRVLERKRSERVDSTIDDPEIDQDSARRLNMRAALYVPLMIARSRHRRGHRAGQTRTRPAVQSRRPAPRRGVRSARERGRRPLASRRAGRAPAASCPRRRRSAAGSRVSSTTRPARR